MDTHAATEQAAVTSLQGVIYRVLDDDRIGSFRLRCVPVSFSFIQLGGQRQLKPPLPDGKFKPTLPAGLTKAD